MSESQVGVQTIHRWLGEQEPEQDSEEDSFAVTSVFLVTLDIPVGCVMLKSTNFVEKTSLDLVIPPLVISKVYKIKHVSLNVK